MKKLYLLCLMSCLSIAGFGQTTFSYTGALQTYTVPAGVTAIQVDVQGATGGNSVASAPGGKGGRVQAVIAVTPGQVLNIFVGGAGSAATTYGTAVATGGYYVGGTAGGYGGGGGGGSDIRIGDTALSSRVLVAAGGGGGGFNCGSTAEQGGDGGGLTGGTGYQCGSPTTCYTGSGGTPTAGGLGATCYSSIAGSSGAGGAGIYVYSGGGGGGYYGGGGAAYGGGGGGSSYANTTYASGVIMTSGYNTAGNGVVILTPLSPCTGTPTAGTASVSPGTGGTSTVFTLSLTGASAATGLTYQWQSSPDGTTWTNITGATTGSYSFTGISVATCFRCIVTCTASGLSATSGSSCAAYAILPTCLPTSSSWFSESGELIYGANAFNVTGYLGSSLSDGSLYSSADGTTGYLDHTSVTPLQLQQGGHYSSSVTWGTTSLHQYCQTWIDFNNDGTFQASEEVSPVSGWSSSATPQPTTFNISIPGTADTGYHLMRLRGIWEENSTDIGSAPAHTDPCLINYGGTSPSYWSGDVIDYMVYIVALPPCTGTPSAGSATTTVSSVCPSGSFTLGLTGTPASGLTYQWQSSPDSSTWTNISGATTLPYTTTETSSLYYRCIVTCTSSGLSAASAGVLVTQLLYCYCTPSYYYSNPAASDALSNFTVAGYGGTSINDNGPSSLPSNGYEDESTSISISFQQSGVYAGSITYNTTWEEYEDQVWIDFNDNGTFETSEEVTPDFGVTGCSGTGSSATFSLSIPLTANPGVHRMRVRQAETYNCTPETDVDPCNTISSFSGDYYYYGVTRDYTATIVALPACSGTVTPGTTVVTPAVGGLSTVFTLSLSGATVASGLTYQWQSSPDGIAWTNISGATSATYTFTGISASTYYQCIITCTASSSTGTSTAFLTTYELTASCFPTTSSWYAESGSVVYGADAFTVTGFSGSTLTETGLTSAASPSTGYLDHTSTTPLQLQQGGLYASSVTWYYTSIHQYCQVWIDFNNDGTFQSTEEVSPVSGWNASTTPQPTTFNVAVPTTADTGYHLMRLRGIWEENSTDIGSAPAHVDPCLINYGGVNPNYWSGDVIDYRVYIVALPPCTGTPSAGAATTSATPICPSTTFDLNITGTAAGGETYQWQSSTDSATWTNISGATTIPYTATETATSYYRCVVTCTSSGLTANSAGVLVSYLPYCYCTPSYYYSNPSLFDALSNFTLTGYSGSTINDNGPTTLPSNGFEDRTSISIDLEQAGVYSGSITYNTNFEEYEDQVWIDFNDNGTFETSEEVTPDFGVTGCSGSGSSATYTLTIPSTATVGVHRMRVRQAETYNCTPETDMDPCNSVSSFSGDYYYYGCTRDYLANIIALPTCSGTPSAGSATTTATSICPSGTFTLNITGLPASGESYQWQTSPDSTTWTNIAGATTLPYTGTATASAYYRCNVICTGSGITASSYATYVAYLPYCYCVPSYYYSSPSSFDALSNFSLNGYAATTINDNGPSTLPSNGFEDRTSISIQLQQNGVYSGSITYNTNYESYEDQVWIDFNDNGTFETSEEVTPDFGVTGCSTFGSSATYTLTIPLTATPGNHRMRVRQAETYSCTVEPDMDPCNYVSSFSGTYYYYGVARDYTAQIIALPACTGTPNPGVVYASDTTGCVAYSSTLTDTGSTIATGLAYQWQSSTDGATWTAVAGATTTTYTAAVTATTWYRLRVTCDSSGLSAYTIPTLLSITPAPGPINCSAGGAPGGPFALCFTTTGASFSGAATGGTWSNAPTTYGTVAATTGAWTPTGTTGTTTITYTIGACSATATLSINSLPPSTPTLSTGSVPLCAYSTLTLADATPGGVWSSTNTGIATVDASGNVTGAGNGVDSIVYNDGCGSAYYPLTVNGSALTLAPSGPVCGGTNIVISATYATGTGVSYSWAGPGGTSGTTALAITAVSGADVGTYTFTTTTSSTTGSCVETVTLPLAVTPAPVVAITSPTYSTMCGGIASSVTTSTNVVPATAKLLYQDFNSGLTGEVGGTWSITNTGASSPYNWAITTPSSWSDVIISGDGSNYIGANADLAGFGTVLNTYFTSPTFSTVGYSAATLSFNYYFDNGAFEDIAANITYSTDGGTTWTTLYDYMGTGTTGTTSWTVGSPNQTITLPSGAVGMPSVQIRWQYSSNWGFYWAVDNIDVEGTPTPTYSWTGGTGLSCTTCTSPTITPTTVGTDVYTVTATVGGCSTSAYDTFVVNPTPSVITGSPLVCIGGTSTLHDSVSGGTWTTSNPAICGVSSTGVLSGITAGTAIISYTLSSGCAVSVVVTVSSSAPAAVTGTTAICAGSTTTLTDLTTGGTWTSGTTTVATVSTSGVVTGAASGTSVITYSTGCGNSTLTVTVTGAPASIGGSTSVCPGSTTTVTDATTGGTWSSSSTSVAGISTSGVVSGLTPGTTTISYTTTCGTATQVVTVSSTPAAIAGPTSVCLGSAITLTDASSGGSWVVAHPGAIVGSSTGIVTAVGVGVDTVEYVTACGTSTYPITMNAPTASVTGAGSVCSGSTITLTDSTVGGTWTSGSTGVATVSTGGVVTGVSGGTAVITYTGSCGSRTAIVTVNTSSPATIAGSTTLCAGATSSLTDASAGGTWSTGATGIATVSTSGVLTGVAGGTTTVSYSTGCGTPAIASVTVNPLPAAISGTLSVCAGSTTSLTDSIAGGTWSSSSTTVATVDATTGVVSGMTAGTTHITYTLGCGTAVVTVTVNTGTPAAIVGAGTLCQGAGLTLSDPTAGGFWSSSSTATATVGGSTGIVTGVSGGTATISYTTGCGVPVTAVVTVNPTPSAITGSTTVCVSGVTTLGDAVTGGTWTSGNLTLASVGSLSGIVSGVAAGVDTITYANACGSIKQVMTIIGAPATITGTATVCVGGTSILADATTGGTWSSSATGIATVDASLGIVTGLAVGTTVITYGSTCGNATLTVTVNGAPSSIVGTSSLCIGSVTTFTDATTGGSWISGSTGVASVVGTSGVVTGAASGTDVITYSTGCGFATFPVTVGSSIAISGTPTVCVGSVTDLTDAFSGGTWSSSDLTVATVTSSTGQVTGVAPGVVNINYNSGTSCGSASISVTVNGAPAPIIGIDYVCTGASTSLSDASSGGTWSSSATSVATVNPTSGSVTGLSVGTTTISYSTGCGLASTYTVSVNGAPAFITGTAQACASATTTLADVTSGGTWTSTATSVATVDSVSGVVTGIAAGTATISYVNGCGTPATVVVTINGAPAAITGATNVCISSSVTLSDATSGGSWTATGAATVGSTSGVVTGGSSAGTAIITYSNACGFSTSVVAVNGAAAPITGTSFAFCPGGTDSLSDASAPGTWTSSNTAVATVGSTGVVTGVGAGSATISFTNGCGAPSVASVTVNPNPSAISGLGSICSGITTTLTDSLTGGTWTSGTTTVATIGGTSGILFGGAAGTSVVTYTIPSTGCFITKNITVQPLTSVGSTITGTDSVCSGSTLTLSDTVIGPATGETWSSSNTAVATVSGGVVSGVSTGSVTITFTATGCGTSSAYKTLNVVTTPDLGTVSGPATLCVGGTGTYVSTVTGGNWSSSNTAVGTVVAGTGVATGVSVGSMFVVYSRVNACGLNEFGYTVNVLGTPSAILGSTSVCTGAVDTLADSIAGGVWVSSDLGTAHVDSFSGVVTGLGTTGGLVTISYTTGCGTPATVTFTVNPLPSAAAIVGATNLCPATSITLTDATAGGVWSASNPNAFVLGGVVTGAAAGLDTIVYEVNSVSCGSAFATAVVTINPLPVAGILTGATDSVCTGATITLTASASGGTFYMTNGHATQTGGVINGLTAGMDTLVYKVTSMYCGSDSVYAAVTVVAQPNAGSITGTLSLCVGHTDTLFDVQAGGTWSSANAAVATVSGGLVGGVAPGTDSIVYTVTNYCGTAATTKVVTVNTLPSAGTITGNDTVCSGATLTLHDAIAGGIWTAANGNLTISTGGAVTGVTPWMLDTVNYTVTNMCGSTVANLAMYVLGKPIVGSVTGAAALCVGSTLNLGDSTTGGAWTAINGTATVSATGMVTGVSAGMDTVVYTVTNICGIGAAGAVVEIDSPYHANVSGFNHACIGEHPDTLAGTPAGGTWSVMNPLDSVSSTGLFYGVVVGKDSVFYSLTNACGTSRAAVMVAVYTKAECDSLNGVRVVTANNGAITVFPNPNSGSFTIVLPELRTNTTVVIMDMYGNVVMSKSIDDNTSNEIPFDVYGVANGTYMIKVTSGDNNYVGRVIILQ